jgi:hypothetical protein
LFETHTRGSRSGRCGYCVGLRVSSYWVSPNSRNRGGLWVVTPHYPAIPASLAIVSVHRCRGRSPDREFCRVRPCPTVCPCRVLVASRLFYHFRDLENKGETDATYATWDGPARDRPKCEKSRFYKANLRAARSGNAPGALDCPCAPPFSAQLGLGSCP